MNRKSMARCALIVTPLFAWGCALPQGGRLPKADLPVVHHAAEMKPSVSYKISFIPPGSDKEPKLVEEFVQEFETANLFMRIEPAPADADVRMTIVLSQVVAVTSKQFALYLATGGLSPIRVPCMYELQAEIHGCLGKNIKYDIQDNASKLVWDPGWPPVDWPIDPTSSYVRRNLYRTLMMQMNADGLLKRCAE